MIKHSYLLWVAMAFPALTWAYDVPKVANVDEMIATRPATASLDIEKQLKSLDATDNELNALRFLYAYMSDPDMGGYSPEFYLKNVRSTLRALDEMPWGKTLPNREMMHFVLPLRVNNEALDMSRPAFYEELKDRVKGLSMADAILEVNHWCHEKVTYKPSDGRTSSPLSSVSQAIGRCGEESTFTVAALRSVGIPARQVYTPRWAHTDDNHAWVEAWADGKWYFLGACEPEPVLNLAWFNAPASRGMLMNTNVFGIYDGPEETLAGNRLGCSINVTSNYAPVRVARMRVVDNDGKPVPDANVNFTLYNYAEFYPLARRVSDSKGDAQLTTGCGDVIVWASDGKHFGLTQITADCDTVAPVRLCYPVDYNGEMTFDLTPPPSRPIVTPVTDAQKAENAARLLHEDNLRNAYMSTFANDSSIEGAAKRLGVERERLEHILKDSRGNHARLVDAMAQLPASLRPTAISLLENVTEKDRRDISPEVLVAHVKAYKPAEGFSDEVNNAYVLNPRVAYEALTDYRAPLREFFMKETGGKSFEDAGKLADWISENISDGSQWNPTRLRTEPLSTLYLRSGDASARKVLFVAAARSLSLPARLDMVRGEAQYLDAEGNWHDVLKSGSDEKASSTPKGTLRLKYEKQGYLENPSYYFHFTISRMVDGMPRLLEYDEGDTSYSSFAEGMTLDAGEYVLTTGQRLADGGVLARLCFFSVKEGETTDVTLDIRKDDTAVSVIGNLNAEVIYRTLDTKEEKSILSTTGRGYYILGLLRNGHEPSVHTLNDISLLKEQLEKRGKKLLLLFEEGTGSGFDKSLYPGLPAGTAFGEDIDGGIFKEIRESLNLDSQDLPLFVIADTFNRIVFVSQGYTIGLGETIVKTLDKIGE